MEWPEKEQWGPVGPFHGTSCSCPPSGPASTAPHTLPDSPPAASVNVMLVLSSLMGVPGAELVGTGWGLGAHPAPHGGEAASIRVRSPSVMNDEHPLPLDWGAYGHFLLFKKNSNFSSLRYIDICRRAHRLLVKTENALRRRV